MPIDTADSMTLYSSDNEGAHHGKAQSNSWRETQRKTISRVWIALYSVGTVAQVKEGQTLQQDGSESG
jgi:hypothetical protein